jgi:hypothetical protein
MSEKTMGWYCKVRNLSNGQESKSEFKYGTMPCNLDQDVWEENNWSKDDILYFHDMEDGSLKFYHIPDGIEPITTADGGQQMPTSSIIGTLNKRVIPWEMTLLTTNPIVVRFKGSETPSRESKFDSIKHIFGSMGTYTEEHRRDVPTTNLPWTRTKLKDDGRGIDSDSKQSVDDRSRAEKEIVKYIKEKAPIVEPLVKNVFRPVGMDFYFPSNNLLFEANFRPKTKLPSLEIVQMSLSSFCKEWRKQPNVVSIGYHELPPEIVVYYDTMSPKVPSVYYYLGESIPVVLVGGRKAEE